MIPILYASDEQNFTSNGLGRLADAVSCKATEERNGIYEVEMEYPVGGRHFGQLLLSNIIFCRASQDPTPQAFRIYEVTDAIDGLCTVRAQHISYQLTAIPVEPFTASTPSDAVSYLSSNSVIENPFTFQTDLTTGAFEITQPDSVRAVIGGITENMLTMYGAEVKWDMYDVYILAERGENRGKVVRYGKNITDITQEQSIEETITGIYPYYSDSEGNYVDLTEKVILSPMYVYYPYKRISPLDLSNNFAHVPTEAELRTKANEYMSKVSLGVPRLSIDVSYVDDQTHNTPVYLCDTVTVIFEKLGINVLAKVSQVVWDVLLDRYDTMTVGVEFDSVADAIVSSEERAKASSLRTTTRQVKAATQKIQRETDAKLVDVKYVYIRPNEINTTAISNTNTGNYLVFDFNLDADQEIVELHINTMMVFSNITTYGTVSVILELDETEIDSWDISYCEDLNGANTMLQYNRLLDDVSDGDHQLIVKLEATGLDITPTADYNDAWIFARKITSITPPDPRQVFIDDLINRLRSARAVMSKSQLIDSYYVYLAESPQKNGPWSSVGNIRGYSWYANIQRNGHDTIIDSDFSLAYNDSFYANPEANYGDKIKRNSCGEDGFVYLYKLLNENDPAPAIADMTETVSRDHGLWTGPAIVSTKPFYSARIVTNIPIFATSSAAAAYADYCDLYWSSGSDTDLANVRTYLENNVHLADWLANE